MKRSISLFLVIIISISAFVFAAVTANAVTSGNYTFELLENGTAKITKYTGSESELFIPDRIGGYVVSALARESFSRCSSLVSVTIPDTVTEMGSYAFEQCENLESVILPDSVNRVSYGEFSGCKKLHTVTIPEGVKIIDTYAFRGCSGLESIDIPDSVVMIERNAFDNTGLTEITIPENVVSIGLQAFFHCEDLEKVTLSNHLKVIYNGAFYYCDKLKSIRIPSGVEYIDATAVGYKVGDKGQAVRNNDFIIYGKAGTEAESYAKSNGIMFEEITEPRTKPIKGDIDGDGEITIVDTTYTQRYLAGLQTPDFGIGEPIES